MGRLYAEKIQNQSIKSNPPPCGVVGTGLPRHTGAPQRQRGRSAWKLNTPVIASVTKQSSQIMNYSLLFLDCRGRPSSLRYVATPLQ